MKLQVVSKYIALSQEGLVSQLKCPVDQGLLQSNLDFDDQIYLYCLSCSYKSYIGLNQYDFMESMVEKNRNTDIDWKNLNEQHKKWKEENKDYEYKYWSI